MNTYAQHLELSTLKAIAGDATVSTADAVARIDDIGVTEQDFSTTATRTLFAVLVSALRSGRAPDAIGLINACRGQAPRDMVLDVVTNFELAVSRSRLEALHDEATRARAEELLATALGAVKDRTRPLPEVLEAARTAAGQLGNSAPSVRSSESDLLTFIDRLEAVQTGKLEPVLRTGIDALDFFIGGLKRTLTIVGSMPGVGKSALIAGIVRNLIARGDKVGVVSLEDEREWLTRRLLAEASSVPLFVLGSRPLGNLQMHRVGEASSHVYDQLKNLVMDDRPGMTTADVVASARRMVAMGCRAVLVDHLGEIRLERSDRHDLDVMDALQQLRAIAKVHQVPVLVACHLRRREGLDTKTQPKLSDFAFSASVERMARVALGLYRSGDQLGVVVLKQTEGAAGLDFELNVEKQAGVVSQTPVSDSMREAQKWAVE